MIINLGLMKIREFFRKDKEIQKKIPETVIKLMSITGGWKISKMGNIKSIK